MPRQKFIGPLKLSERDLKAKSIEEGDCWIWMGGYSSFLYPVMRRFGQNITVRRVIIMELKNKPLRDDQPVRMTCGNKSCVNPAHTQPSTFSAVATLAGKQGKFSGLKRCAAIANYARTRGKLDMEKADYIRASDERPTDLAKQFGVSLSNIKKIRAGEAWKNYNTPWAGLMR